MADLISAARKQIEYAVKTLAKPKEAASHLDKADAFLERASVAVAALSDLEPEADDPRFIVIDKPDEVYLVGGTEAGNPNGVTFTLGDARKWWETVFDQGLNIGQVRPSLTPGAHVLSAQGYADAKALGQSSIYAPEDYNPLNLTVVP